MGVYAITDHVADLDYFLPTDQQNLVRLIREAAVSLMSDHATLYALYKGPMTTTFKTGETYHLKYQDLDGVVTVMKVDSSGEDSVLDYYGRLLFDAEWEIMEIEDDGNEPEAAH